MDSESLVPGSAEDWLRYAKSDLEPARIEKPEGVLLENLCFHAQQAAEKTLKAVLIFLEIDFPLYCEDRIEQFSEVFGRIQYNVDPQLSYTEGVYLKKTLHATSSARDTEDKISIFPLSEKNDMCPEHAISVSTRFASSLIAFRGKQDDDFLLKIESETDSNGCTWKFLGTSARTRLSIDESYMGRDLEELKKTFNELLRRMMRMLSGKPDRPSRAMKTNTDLTER